METWRIDISYGETSSDCTSKYYVFTNCKTVKEFIDEWLANNPKEWGQFIVRAEDESWLDGKSCEYSNGRITSKPFDDKTLNCKIKKVGGSGGWSRSDFIFTVDKHYENMTEPLSVNVPHFDMPDYSELFKSDAFNYESPIRLIEKEIHNGFMEKTETGVMMSITQQIGVDVDKEELIKALNYDRHSYEKGFRDASLSSKTAHWIEHTTEYAPNKFQTFWECSECGEVNNLSNYCPNCGAKMKEDDIDEK